VARPEARVDDARLGHRKENARFGDAEVSDDDRSVVQLVHRLGHEERNEELAGDHRFDGNALRHDELVEVRVLLERDESSHAVPRELGRRRDHLVDDARFLRARESTEERAAADAHEPAADVVLEDDHHDEDDRRQERGEQIEERDER
jgi:hypothetical protein